MFRNLDAYKDCVCAIYSRDGYVIEVSKYWRPDAGTIYGGIISKRGKSCYLFGCRERLDLDKKVWPDYLRTADWIAATL